MLPAIAVADTFKEEKIPDNARVRFGLYFFKPRAGLKYLLIFRSVELFEALRALKTDLPIGQCILDVQGQGLMVAVEFASPSPSTFDFRPRGLEGCNSKTSHEGIEVVPLDEGMLLLTMLVYETAVHALMSLGSWEGHIVSFVLGAIFIIFSVVSIRCSVLMTFVDGRLRDWCSSPHGLGLSRVTHPGCP